MTSPESRPPQSPLEESLYLPPHFPKAVAAAVIPIDKPAGWTSFDVVKKLRGILQMRKVGHAGTLDPMATGLLVCLAGKATRRMEEFMLLDKTYTGRIRLGASTPSYDAETEIIAEHPTDHLTDDQIERACKALTGDIEQIPPMYSAVKVGGERLYKKARRGEEVARKSRPVTIYRFDVTERAGADVYFEVRCSKGTYIRTLAHDVGEALGVGGHLAALRRTRIGPLSVNDAWTIDALSEAARSSGEA